MELHDKATPTTRDGSSSKGRRRQINTTGRQLYSSADPVNSDEPMGWAEGTAGLVKTATTNTEITKSQFNSHGWRQGLDAKSSLAYARVLEECGIRMIPFPRRRYKYNKYTEYSELNEPEKAPEDDDVKAKVGGFTSPILGLGKKDGASNPPRTVPEIHRA